MPQIDYQIMWHIILKLYIQIVKLKKWCSLFQVDSLPSSNKKLSSQPRGPAALYTGNWDQQNSPKGSHGSLPAQQLGAQQSHYT